MATTNDKRVRAQGLGGTSALDQRPAPAVADATVPLRPPAAPPAADLLGITFVRPGDERPVRVLTVDPADPDEVLIVEVDGQRVHMHHTAVRAAWRADIDRLGWPGGAVRPSGHGVG